MAWVKVPAEHHPLFHAALPKDPRVSTMSMFGGVAAKVNGHIFGGLFGRGAIVKLGDADKTAALAIDGAEMFDPMGNGRGSKSMVMLPEMLLDEPDELRAWLQKALDHVASLPAKTPARKAPAKKPAAAKKPAMAKRPTARKPAAKKKTAAAKRKA